MYKLSFHYLVVLANSVNVGSVRGNVRGHADLFSVWPYTNHPRGHRIRLSSERPTGKTEHSPRSMWRETRNCDYWPRESKSCFEESFILGRLFTAFPERPFCASAGHPLFLLPNLSKSPFFLVLMTWPYHLFLLFPFSRNSFGERALF